MKQNPSKKVFIYLLIIIFFLFLLNTLSYLNLYYNNLDVSNFFFRKTNFNSEKNLPTIFSSMLHLFASILLAYVALGDLRIRKRKIFWYGMSFIFFFLSMDEILRIHESIIGHSSFLFENSGIFVYGWIVYYFIALVLLGLVFYKSLLELPREILVRFITAGFIFVLGAVGIENITGHYIWQENLEPALINTIPEIFMLSTLEELLEMLGISYFIYGICVFIDVYKIPSQAILEEH